MGEGGEAKAKRAKYALAYWRRAVEKERLALYRKCRPPVKKTVTHGRQSLYDPAFAFWRVLAADVNETCKAAVAHQSLRPIK